jgi:hypothetical protein
LTPKLDDDNRRGQLERTIETAQGSGRRIAGHALVVDRERQPGGVQLFLNHRRPGIFLRKFMPRGEAVAEGDNPQRGRRLGRCLSRKGNNQREQQRGEEHSSF